MKRILVTDSLSPRGLDILKGPDGFQVHVKTGLTPEALRHTIRGYDALVIRSGTRVTAEVLDNAHRLRVVGRAGMGVDNVDVGAATRRGIVVMNTPGGNSVTTAEHALALMVSLMRHIPQAAASMKAGRWDKKQFQGRELRGKTLGVVGLGNIGSIVADRARAFEMKVIAYDPVVDPDRAAQLGVELTTFTDLLVRSDIVTIHVPLVDATRHLFDAGAFARMKSGSYLVCAARGGIVDEDALLAALEDGPLAGAALDVFAEEPPGPTPLVTHPRLVCTPHLGASTAEAQEAVAVQVAGQVVDYLVWGTLQNAVNMPCLSSEAAERLRPYLGLARNLGRLQAQLGVDGLEAVELEYPPELAGTQRALLTAACLAGLFSTRRDLSVNPVNAATVARDENVHVVETTTTDAETYTSFLRLNVTTAAGRFSVAGALFGKKKPRVVEIDGNPLEAIPRGHLLVFWNHDQPGVVARLGTVLGEHRVNIARMQLGRNGRGGQAVAVINVDRPVDDDLLAEMRRIPHTIGVQRVSL